MTGFELLERMQDEPELARGAGRRIYRPGAVAEEDAELHTMAEASWSRACESPERLLDETALFLHRVVADLPPDKQRMLERLHGSDEDSSAASVLVVDDDVRNIFALTSVLERRGMKVAHRHNGHEAIALSKPRRTSPSC